jgi:diguanylate cyclase (GGDEF)-like protein/PAS domain S-box-containing protein/putative nucleotidyltransferase with HDIG domain
VITLFIKSINSISSLKRIPMNYNSYEDTRISLDEAEASKSKAFEDALKASKRRLFDIIEFLPDATLAIDINKKVIIWNKAIEKMTGILASEMIGKGDYAYTVPFYGDARPQLMDLVLGGNEIIASKYSNLKKIDQTLEAEIFCPALYENKGAWIFMKVSPLHDQYGNITGAIEIIRDITERKHSEEILKASEGKYRLITENISDVIWVLNLSKDRFEYVSPSIEQLRGITVSEAMKENLEETLTSESFKIIKDGIDRAVESFKRNPGNRKSYINEIQQPCKNGKVIWVETSTKYRYNKDGDIEAVGVSRNIEERKKSEKEIIYLSYHDQLTGLYNRRFYEEELSRLDIARNLPITLVMGDVNGLKLINDSFGHQVGDDLIRKVGDAIKKCCRGDDIIARLGGDEFVIILPKTNSLEAASILTRITYLLLREKVGSIDISISFGFETKVHEEQDIQDVFRNTENNMYRHKLYEGSSMRSKTIDIIMNTLFEKNNREMLHSRRVSEICEAIANKMDIGKDDVNQIKIAGLMHDIGKIGIDENILNKVESLNNEEWIEIKKHCEIGYRILSSANEFSEIANYVLEHQEKWDGTGYPKGLRGEEISLQARIISIADAYDAMTTSRTYGKTFSHDDALVEIKKCSGSQFDPYVTNIFLKDVI